MQRRIAIISGPDLDGDTFVGLDSNGDLLVADGFWARLQRAPLNAFIKAVINGATQVIEAQQVSTDSGKRAMTTIRLDGDPQSDVVIISDPGPGNGGPKALAAAIGAVIDLANADTATSVDVVFWAKLQGLPLNAFARSPRGGSPLPLRRASSARARRDHRA
jgi:hypothetical protein